MVILEKSKATQGPVSAVNETEVVELKLILRRCEGSGSTHVLRWFDGINHGDLTQHSRRGAKLIQNSRSTDCKESGGRSAKVRCSRQ